MEEGAECIDEAIEVRPGLLVELGDEAIHGARDRVRSDERAARRRHSHPADRKDLLRAVAGDAMPVAIRERGPAIRGENETVGRRDPDHDGHVRSFGSPTATGPA